MALADAGAVRVRIRENALYEQLLPQYFGAAVIADPDKLIDAIGESLAAFERSAFFATFDSKYDRSLRGEYVMTALEEMGRDLFFSPMTNCADCHLANNSGNQAGETFTNYRYHNIGIAANTPVREENGLGAAFRDPGLLAHPDVTDARHAGKFKVPSLRNVAVTGPYMHNGIFRDLRTAILFYNRYTVNNAQSRTNPETGRAWGEPEFAATIDEQLLKEGQPIDEGRLRALIAFLETPTDQRFEPLLEERRE
jgi:cytochrome c peroxidase